MRNPARLAMGLHGLFPAAVVGAEMREPGDASLLLPEEAACVGRAVPKRVQEFAAGRLCARRALAEFGITDFPVRVASDRQPLWPEFLVGSITHTDGYCAAVVAERCRLSAIGIDCEVIGRVTQELWPTILGPEEARWLDSLAAVGARSCGHAFVRRQGGTLQVSIPIGRRMAEFSRSPRDSARAGHGEWNLHCRVHAADRPVRSHAANRARTVPRARAFSVRGGTRFRRNLPPRAVGADLQHARCRERAQRFGDRGSAIYAQKP